MKEAYVMDKFIAEFMEAMNGKLYKEVGVPDVVVLPGFAATSTALFEEVADGGWIGVAD